MFKVYVRYVMDDTGEGAYLGEFEAQDIKGIISMFKCNDIFKPGHMASSGYLEFHDTQWVLKEDECHFEIIVDDRNAS